MKQLIDRANRFNRGRRLVTGILVAIAVLIVWWRIFMAK